jgi:hypothetical protein
MVDNRTIHLSQSNVRVDSEGNSVTLKKGMRVSVYAEGFHDVGKSSNLIADETVQPNTAGGWTIAAKWCCLKDEKGIRHESGETI